MKRKKVIKGMRKKREEEEGRQPEEEKNRKSKLQMMHYDPQSVQANIKYAAV